MKMPKGMFKRGSRFYTRRRESDRDRWISLGADLEAAGRKLHLLRAGEWSAIALREPYQPLVNAVEAWLTGYVRTARNAKGVRLARSRARLHLVPFLGGKSVTSITGDDLRRYRLWLEAKELAPQTVSNILCDVRCFFSWCLESGLIERSPIPRRLMPRIEDRLPDRLTAGEVVELVGIPDPHGFVIRLGLGTGLRWAEMCRALASDVVEGVLMVSRTKSGKVRRVPLGPELHRELTRMHGRLVPFSEADSGAFSWTVRRASGVERFHPHMLRHTFACQWLERGGSLPALQQILGHASITTTQRYARLGDDVVREQADRVWARKVVADVVAVES